MPRAADESEYTTSFAGRPISFRKKLTCMPLAVDVALPLLPGDRSVRVAVRESDLRRHLVNELKDNSKDLEEDRIDDPRFAMTAEQLKAKGIDDFQLYYAMETLQRLGSKTMKLAAKPVKGRAQN